MRHAFAVALVIAAFGLRKLLEPVTGTGAPFVLFFGAVFGVIGTLLALLAMTWWREGR